MESIAEPNGDNEQIIRDLSRKIQLLTRVATEVRRLVRNLDQPDPALEMALEDLDAAPGDVMQVEPAHPGQCCVAKYPGEPTFTVVGRDKLAPKIVAGWINLAWEHRVPADKVIDAQEKLRLFEKWQHDNPDKVKLPD